jgi:hypothetical protein
MSFHPSLQEVAPYRRHSCFMPTHPSTGKVDEYSGTLAYGTACRKVCLQGVTLVAFCSLLHR